MIQLKRAITTKEVDFSLWPDVERLFGPNGAVGGCWCMSWRLEKSESWNDVKGAMAKRRFKSGIKEGTIFGIVAYIEDEPVGWCTFGPRRSFAKLDRAPSFKCNDADDVWSIPCFNVKAAHRKKGVARALLQHALKAMKRRGAQVIEGYPVKPSKDGSYIASFSWTGTHSLFLGEDFEIVGNRLGGKQRVRKKI